MISNRPGRLRNVSYVGYQRYFLTTCTANRNRAFEEDGVAKGCTLQRFKCRLWQPGYHDRILRDDESTEATARYILENPVRAGLARQIGEYPYAGSDLYDVRAILSAWDKQV